jgi:hypothetical protein
MDVSRSSNTAEALLAKMANNQRSISLIYQNVGTKSAIARIQSSRDGVMRKMVTIKCMDKETLALTTLLKRCIEIIPERIPFLVRRLELLKQYPDSVLNDP